MIGRYRVRSAAAALVLATLVAVPSAVPAGAQSPAPVGAPVATPMPRLAADGRIRDADLRHDSRDDRYRTPVGAVPAGTTVRLRIRAGAGDLSGAEVRLTDRVSGASWALRMDRVATEPDAGTYGYEYWEAIVEIAAPRVLDYWFVLHDGIATRYLTDDRALDGGTGTISRDAPDDGGWQITAHDPAFTTPSWTRGAVVYQIFPDRFANGDPSNDPSPLATPGPAGTAERYRQGDVYGAPVLVKGWDQLPEGHCRGYVAERCDEQPAGRDFFGGDLAGIRAHLADLADLGVTVIYLNPIFAAPSNHRYDTSDYRTIDPDLGTLDDVRGLIADAKALGIRVILDGVFNHVSSDSPWFDRYHRYPETGACESAASPMRPWFTFRAPGANQPAPCAPSADGGDDTFYVSWFGYDSIPEVNETPGFLRLVAGEDGVVRQWIGEGTAGWRLDVTDSISADLLRAIRSAAKAADPEAIVLAEQWGDSSPWLLGDQADSTMNYRFRRALLGLVTGGTPDPDGTIDAMPPSAFVRAIEAVREDYPGPAWEALLNLVDSHDTVRILWTLTPGPDDRAAKEAPANLAEGIRSLRILAAIQLTLPGMPSIYYGTEAGLTGADDPDDRRPYPWDSVNGEVRVVYRTLARARAAHEALRVGALTFVHADDARGTLAFIRRTDMEAALTAANTGDRDRTVAVDVVSLLPDGAVLSDLETGATATVAGGSLTLDLPARSARVLITVPDTDLMPPTAPDGLAAVAAPGAVALTWEPVDGAAGYLIWRSLLAGGGFEPLAETSLPAYTDTAVRDGAAVHYAITASDAAGNRSMRSAEVTAFPQLAVVDVRLDLDAPVTATRSASGDGPPVTATVTVTNAPRGVAEGLLVAIGSGPVGSDPATDPAWAWRAAAVVAEVGTTATFAAAVPASVTGTLDVAARASSDGGTTWTIGDRTGSADGYAVTDAGRLDVAAADDTEAPPPPTGLEVVDAAGDHVTLRWIAPDAPDLAGYEILRGDADGGDLVPIGTSEIPIHTDATVAGGGTYRYAVIAIDGALNRSVPSGTLDVEASLRTVAVTFTVTVPDHTPAGDQLFIAGDFQGWAPGETPMTQVDPTHWTITIPFEDATRIEYKYTRGSWEAVEKDDGCGEIPNRTLTATYGPGGTMAVVDEVGKWRDLDACG